MRSGGQDAIVITALDEIAWLFNLRGNDIPYNPVFRGYAILGPEKGHSILYIPINKQTREVREHLRADGCVAGAPEECVQIKDYEAIFEELTSIIDSNNWGKVVLGDQIAYSGGASYAIYQRVPKDKLIFKNSPVMLMKAVKNKVIYLFSLLQQRLLSLNLYLKNYLQVKRPTLLCGI